MVGCLAHITRCHSHAVSGPRLDEHAVAKLYLFAGLEVAIIDIAAEDFRSDRQEWGPHQVLDKLAGGHDAGEMPRPHGGCHPGAEERLVKGKTDDVIPVGV